MKDESSNNFIFINDFIFCRIYHLFNQEKNVTIVELTEKESPANVYVWDHMPLTYNLEEDCMTRDNGEFGRDRESIGIYYNENWGNY